MRIIQRPRINNLMKQDSIEVSVCESRKNIESMSPPVLFEEQKLEVPHIFNRLVPPFESIRLDMSENFHDDDVNENLPNDAEGSSLVREPRIQNLNQNSKVISSQTLPEYRFVEKIRYV
jgi:hypothetical protein